MEAPIKRSRRRFGPLFYTTTAVALLVIVSRPFWQNAMEQSRAWRLAAQLRDPTASTRRVAADGLVQLGPAATSWVIRAMRDNDPKIRKLACSILVRTAPARAEDALAALLVAAKDSDASVRVTAVGQLELLIIRHGSPPAATVRESRRGRSATHSATTRRRCATRPAGRSGTSARRRDRSSTYWIEPSMGRTSPCA